MFDLFITAVNCFGRSSQAKSKAALEKERRQFLKLKASLRDNLDRLRMLDQFRNAEAALTAAIVELDRYHVGPYGRAVIHRDRGDPKLRSFLEEFLYETRRLFRSPLYGTVATIASVLFDQAVSIEKVREAHRRSSYYVV